MHPTTGHQARHQRADGSALLRVGCGADGSSCVRDLYQASPCRLLFPEAEPGEPLQAVLLTTSGGLTGGDRVQMRLQVDAGARATVTTQAAEKLYRSLPGTQVRAQVDVEAGAGAWAEWLAQETILFDQARLRRTFTADLAAGARLLATESVVFGRTAMGESFETGLLHDAWRIRRGGVLVWADALHLSGAVREQRRQPFGFGTAVAYSTVLYAGAEAPQLLEPVRALLPGPEGTATVLGELLLVRLLCGDAAAMRAAVIRIAGLIRARAGGADGALPRVWHC
ncbi:MAG TPA: urease accessory protein UreD [Steroidobacteraceae bacterium]|nr:urease accessory protein UreD [Steroidobacteraceae bacterium]